MKKLGWSVEWMLLASAVHFFLIGRYFAPYYEDIVNEASSDEGAMISFGVFSVSAVFAVSFMARLVYRYKVR